ncbi:hypothetical protein ACFY3B_07525 [Micromonospora parva]|uniref:Uncharacterized protein n=1 Tax=Micromonospora parva TaxID=1464048 RepID=A0ABW6VP83_9ACTN
MRTAQYNGKVYLDAGSGTVFLRVLDGLSHNHRTRPEAALLRWKIAAPLIGLSLLMVVPAWFDTVTWWSFFGVATGC